MRRTTTTAALTAVLLALTGCSSGGETTTAAKPSASPTPSPTPSYTFDDCKALLEENYQAGAPRDASNDPECAHLTDDQYTQVVGEVLAGHKDEIMDQAAREVLWDSTWEEMAQADRDGMCHHIEESGVEVVGQALDDAGDIIKDQGVEMAEYLRDNKC
ncbi:hypothetical protein ACIOWI_29715 [Streptomyces sp. NPDC087659]|uniref:hypothetical protein n=1 Tax=Streptomyces sp. NPDC087659 TaxID=3365801 RepID=UPI0037FE30D0